MPQPQSNPTLAHPSLPLAEVLQLYPADALTVGGPPLRDFLAAQDLMRDAWSALTRAVVRALGPEGQAERAAIVDRYQAALLNLFTPYSQYFDACVAPSPCPNRAAFRDAYLYAVGRYRIATFLMDAISALRALPGWTPEIHRLAGLCECQLIHCIAMAMGVYMGEFRAAAVRNATAVAGAHGVVGDALHVLAGAGDAVQHVRHTVAGAGSGVAIGVVADVATGAATGAASGAATGASTDVPSDVAMGAATDVPSDVAMDAATEAPSGDATYDAPGVAANAPSDGPKDAPSGEATGVSTVSETSSDADGEYELEEGEINP